MTAGRTAMTPEEQLDDLQRRFQLLEGERKATYETATMNIKQNKEIIKQMKEENKTLRNDIAKMRNEKPLSTEKNYEVAMTEVQQLQRHYDQLRHENEKKNLHLKELESKLNELNMDAKMPKTEDSPSMRHIRVLENRLDKAMIKYNEAKSISHTYEVIRKRLQEDRIGFDNHLASIERTLKSKERDYEELLLLSHDAYHAKEMAQAELHRFEQGVMDERNQRDKEVQEKKVLVQQRVEMNVRLEQREKVLKKQQEMERQQERYAKEATAVAENNTSAQNDQLQEEKQMLANYEEAFSRIKEATGVNDVNEVIQKFLTQEETRKNLTALTKENQAKIDKYTDERRKLRAHVDDLKFSSGGSAGRRQQVDEFEKELNEGTEKFQRNQAKFERVAKMLIDMKSGIGHLSEKLGIMKLGDEAPIEMSDETVEDVLQQSGLKITKLMGKVQQSGLEDSHANMDSTDYEEKMLARSQSDVRVKLHENEQEIEDDDDDFDEELDEDVWNRKHVKYSSEQMVERQQTRNRRKAKTKKGPK